MPNRSKVYGPDRGLILLTMTPLVAAIVTALLYALHQDLWLWRLARPLVFGVLPIGLFYHAAFTVACALLMWLLVRSAWPAHLERLPTDE